MYNHSPNERAEQPLTTLQGASFSADKVYRYALWRQWGDDSNYALWVMLNPSVAGYTMDDPTIRRCVRFSKDWGKTGMAVVNLYGLVSTDPAALVTHDDPVGLENDWHIELLARHPAVKTVICAWGAVEFAGSRERIQTVNGNLSRFGIRPWCLGLTKNGSPRHPLYLAAYTSLRKY